MDGSVSDWLVIFWPVESVSVNHFHYLIDVTLPWNMSSAITRYKLHFIVVWLGLFHCHFLVWFVSPWAWCVCVWSACNFEGFLEIKCLYDSVIGYNTNHWGAESIHFFSLLLYEKHHSWRGTKVQKHTLRKEMLFELLPKNTVLEEGKKVQKHTLRKEMLFELLPKLALAVTSLMLITFLLCHVTVFVSVHCQQRFGFLMKNTQTCPKSRLLDLLPRPSKCSWHLWNGNILCSKSCCRLKSSDKDMIYIKSCWAGQ